VSARQERHEHVIDHLILPDDHPGDLLFEPGAGRGAGLEELDGGVGFRRETTDAHDRRFRSARHEVLA
jgi:hypothetical protein